MTQEPIYNIDKLIIKLKKLRNKVGDNAEIFTCRNNEYSRITNIKIDEDEDIIITTHTVW